MAGLNVISASCGAGRAGVGVWPGWLRLPAPGAQAVITPISASASIASGLYIERLATLRLSITLTLSGIAPVLADTSSQRISLCGQYKSQTAWCQQVKQTRMQRPDGSSARGVLRVQCLGDA